jgi:transcriptional regulator with XRE-family HTH domain
MDALNGQFSHCLQQNLRSLRRRFNLSQEELAQKVGLNRGNIASYENGTAEPKICNLLKLSHIFGISVVDLTQRDLGEENSIKEAIENQTYFSRHEWELFRLHLEHSDELQEFIKSIYACYQFKAKNMSEIPRDMQFLMSSFDQLHDAALTLLSHYQELIDLLKSKVAKPAHPHTPADTQPESL